MHLCYVDESGTPDLPGNTSHYVLAGLSVPAWHRKTCDADLRELKAGYGVQDTEIHTGWILRTYLEQSGIAGFDQMNWTRRRQEARKLRKRHLLQLQKSGHRMLYLRTKKNYRKTDSYVHLTREERTRLVTEIAERVSKWGFARLFAE